MVKEFIGKVFMNKRNKQLSVALSKKKLMASHPDLKFSKDLFIKWSVFRRKK